LEVACENVRVIVGLSWEMDCENMRVIVGLSWEMHCENARGILRLFLGEGLWECESNFRIISGRWNVRTGQKY
jgi:hypothetical protein